MFNFKNKQEKIGMILGGVCFLPVFLVCYALSMFKNPIVGFVLLIITQSLWLTSITLSTKSLEIENRELRDKLKELQGGN